MSAGGGGRGRVLARVEFSEIHAPGVYVMERGGLLVRVPPNGMAEARNPLISVCGDGPVWMWRLSEDPWLPLHKARSIAANHDLTVAF